MTREAAAVRRYVRSADQAQLADELDLLPLTGFELGRIVIVQDRATVATTVVVAGDRPLTLPITTTLVREHDAWRVDYGATARDISRHSELARLLDHLSTLGDDVKRGVDQAVDQFKIGRAHV